jgi:hypothetical protein
MEKIVSSINAFGANRLTQPSRQERGLCLVIANDEKKLEVGEKASLPDMFLLLLKKLEGLLFFRNWIEWVER